MSLATLLLALTPWAEGSPSFFFGVGDVALPRFSVGGPWAEQLYSFAALPLEVIAGAPEIGRLVCFSGEGVVTPRPFVVYVVWTSVGLATALVARRRAATKLEPPTSLAERAFSALALGLVAVPPMALCLDFLTGVIVRGAGRGS